HVDALLHSSARARASLGGGWRAYAGRCTLSLALAHVPVPFPLTSESLPTLCVREPPSTMRIRSSRSSVSAPPQRRHLPFTSAISVPHRHSYCLLTLPPSLRC